MADEKRQSQYDYAVFKVEEDALVSQEEKVYYDDDRDRLTGVVEAWSRGFEWALVASWRNDTAGEATIELQYTTELRVTEGSEIEKTRGIGGGFLGISIGIGGSRKTFQSTETTSSETRGVTMTVPANESVYMYQKVYHFKSIVWFINTIDGQRVRMGGVSSFLTPTTAEDDVDIASSEYWTRSQKLPNTIGIARIDTVDLHVTFEATLPWGAISAKARAELEERGVRPSNRFIAPPNEAASDA